MRIVVNISRPVLPWRSALRLANDWARIWRLSYRIIGTLFSHSFHNMSCQRHTQKTMQRRLADLNLSSACIVPEIELSHSGCEFEQVQFNTDDISNLRSDTAEYIEFLLFKTPEICEVKTTPICVLNSIKLCMSIARPSARSQKAAAVKPWQK